MFWVSGRRVLWVKANYKAVKEIFTALKGMEESETLLVRGNSLPPPSRELRQ